jgi:hypothetical protein
MKRKWLKGRLSLFISMSILLLLINIATGDNWIKVDLGKPYDSSYQVGLSDVFIGDGDRDGYNEAFFSCRDNGHIYGIKMNNNTMNWFDAGLPINASLVFSDTIIVGDADNDGLSELYSSCSKYSGPATNHIYQIIKQGDSWNSSDIGASGSYCEKICIGDGDNDGNNELYSADENGHVYKFIKKNQWNNIDIGNSSRIFYNTWFTPGMTDIIIGDADNDGDNEIYAASEDNHIYQFKFNKTSWIMKDLGAGEIYPPSGGIVSVKIADIDKDGRNELYGLSYYNSTVWRYDWNSTSGSWVIVKIVTIGTNLDASDMDIGDLGSDGMSDLYIGTNDKHIYQVSYNGTNDQWVASSIGSTDGFPNALKIGSIGNDSNSQELFIASSDGHAYQFFTDRTPPNNPTIFSDTHPIPGDWYTKSEVHILWEDVGSDISGIDGYSILWDNEPLTIPDNIKDLEQITHGIRKTLPDGNNWYFHIRAVDNSGNWNTTASHFGPICIDSVSPEIDSLEINGGVVWTNNSIVTLTLNATDSSPSSGLWQMAFSNDGLSWSDWEPYAQSRIGWDLCNTVYGSSNDGDTYWVFANVRDRSKNEAQTGKIAMASINLDIIKPDISSLLINQGAQYTNLSIVELRVFASDLPPNSGLEKISFSNDGLHWSNWVDWVEIFNWSLISDPGGYLSEGNRTVYCRVMDRAGNIGIPLSDSIFFDMQPPIQVGIRINDGNEYTNNSAVILSIFAIDPYPSSGLKAMAISLDGTNWNPWLSFSDKYPYESSLNEGLLTVYIQIMDYAGNVGVMNSSSIILDPIPPTVTILNLPTKLDDFNFTVSWIGYDNLSGVRGYYMQYQDLNSSGSWIDWLDNVTIMNSTFHGLDGHSYSFRARAEDNAGNLGRYPILGTEPVQIDIPKPLVSITEPVAYSVITGAFTIKGNASHLKAGKHIEYVQIQLDNGTWITVNGTNNWTFQMESTNLLNGPHVVRARSFDGTKYSDIESSEFIVKNVKIKQYDITIEVYSWIIVFLIIILIIFGIVLFRMKR